MKGYVKNKTSEWAYAMKRSVRPGGQIPIKELYEQYGEKYNIAPGEAFINWLTTVKLRNNEQWEIVYSFNSKNENVTQATPEEDIISDEKQTSPAAIKSIMVEDIVNLTVRKARELLPKILDKKLLEYSLAEARQLSDKDSLCRLLQKRIRELEIAA